MGADLWRLKRLTGAGLGRGDAVLSVGTDRLVGALGLTAFVAFAGTELPVRMLLVVAGVSLAAILVVLVLRRVRPGILPSRPLPAPGTRPRPAALRGLPALHRRPLLGAVGATGTRCRRWPSLGAFGASQLAGAVPDRTGPARATARSSSDWSPPGSLGRRGRRGVHQGRRRLAAGPGLGGSSLLHHRRTAVVAAV